MRQIINRAAAESESAATKIRDHMQAQLLGAAASALSDLKEECLVAAGLSEAQAKRFIAELGGDNAADENDGEQSHLHQVLQCGVLPDAVNLGRPKESTQAPMTPDQLRQFAQELPANTHVTSLNLSYQSIGTDAMRELVAPLALLTSLRELHLAGACALR